MNQNQIQQLTSHLSQALDQNYDVVNMDAVLSVICALEGTTITKEQLEATRLAKYINQLRRRTKNEHLARRAKSLLKKWREMVGIQQNVNESHQLSSVNVSLPPMQQLPMQQQPSSDFLKTDSDIAIHLPLSPSQQIIHQDTQYSSDAVQPQIHHTSFSNFVNNVQKENKNIIRRHEATPVIIEQTLANNEAEAAVVIDIASDSDENDHNNSFAVSSKRGNLQNPSVVPASLAIPIPIPSSSPKLKKLKKAKKHKDKDEQNIRGVNTKVADALLQADSEIFSLSNSSMSSIFSGDATTTLGNSQHNKQRLNASELTFTGRFKSVSSQNNNSGGFLTTRSTDSYRKHSGKYDDFNIYDSSGASCSRLSPLNIEDGSRKMESTVDARMQNLTAVFVASNDLENTTSQSRSHLPKKRGRKRGSKGVDSLIARESSTSLSQQIFFGHGSTVKKVKTTKELFNEIQSRKLGVSTTSNLSNSSTTNRTEQTTTHAVILPRPTSSCSDSSIHSPQIIETYSGNVTLMGVDTFSNKLDAANTDSDTITSEPSRDSNKSQDIKGASLDNSNSNSFGIFSKSNMNKKKENFNDITTQLMHLLHSLKSPLSVYEIEEMYLAEMVPCSCLIIEEEVTNALKGEPAKSVSDNNIRSDPKLNLNNDIMVHKMDHQDILLPLERLDNDNEIVENQAKPVRSIFDLDFDDDSDDINSITYEIIKPPVKMEKRKNNLEVRNVSKIVAQLDNNYSQNVETENNDTITPNLPINPAFTVYEDPDCIAKQRFYVQTNKVTNFHINALHNYYIPNINGNWDDSVDTSSSLLSVKNHLIHPLESSYTVTNGADVVPKYGFITSDRIKKDLSSVKFLKPFKAKPFKSWVAPFLGVAKYLPTCRRAKRRLNITSNSLSMQVPGKIMNSQKSSKPVATEMPPLKVNIDVTDRSHNENPVPINVLHTISFDDTSCSSFQDFRESNNLLKLVNDDELQLGAEEIMKNKKKLVQNYWNGCNLNIKTSNNDSSSGSDSEDKSENANENNYENTEEYAVVQRPTSTSHDHIVLTIKKTPSKMNSPANSMTTTITSPIIKTSNSEGNNVKKKSVPDNTDFNPLTKCHLMRLPFRPRHHHYRYHRTSRRKRNTSLKTEKVDLELKHIFNIKETVSRDIRLHEKLFFQHELCGENALGIKERMINYSSSSSSYDDESELEVTSLDGKVDAKIHSKSFDNNQSHNQYNLQIETDTREDKFDSDNSLLLSSSDEDIDGDDVFIEPIFDEANSNWENNSMLKSFNSIYTDSQTNNNLNESNNKYCNNNHLELTNLTRNSIETSAETSTIKKLPLIGVEYRTGYRSSPEVNGTATSIAGYQEFKEWHQVLQLKSYNNEPLIVLPYVVLE